MRFKSLLVAAASAAFTLASLGAAPQANAAGIWDKVKDSGVLTCGAMAANPTGSWAVPGPAKFEGYEINLCRHIALELSKVMGRNIRVDYKETTWGTVVLDLQSDKVDIWPGMSETPERLKAIDMAGPMYELQHCIVTRKGLDGLKTWNDFSKADIKVATVTGTSDEDAVRKLSPNATILSFKERPAAILAVQSGRADGFGTSAVTCLSILQEHQDVFGKVVFPEPLFGRPSSAGMRKDGDGRFHKFVNEWAKGARKDGTITWLLSDAFEKHGLNVANFPPGLKF